MSNNKKKHVKGIAFDARVADFVTHMGSVGDYRESLLRLQDVWDQLTLLSETSGMAADIAATGDEFRALTDTLLDALARRQLDNALRQLRGRAQVAIDLLVRNLFERTADVGFLAVDAAVRAHVQAHAAGEDVTPLRAALEARFRAYVAKYSVYDDVVVLSPEGEVLARLDPSGRSTRSHHPLVAQSLRGDAPFVESFGALDLLDGRRGLVYSAPIRGEGGGRPLGVLCLSFRFDDEMARVFEQLTPSGMSSGVLTVLADDGSVLASADPWQVPVGARLVARSEDEHVLRFAGREYLMARTGAHPYQGYAGPRWQACALQPLALAFRQDDTAPHDLIPAEALQRSALFDEELRGIPRQAHRIQRGLERSVWNGRVRGGRAARGDAAQTRFAAALLQRVAHTGERVERVFAEAISELQQSAVAGLIEEARASAALAVDILDRNLYERANDCRWWSLDPSLQQAAAGEVPPAEAAQVLRHINSLYTVYAQLVLLGRDGRVIATSGPTEAEAARGPLSGDWVRSALSLADDQAWARSPFEPHPLYGDQPTYLYAATVHHDRRPCGAIVTVFDSSAQLHAMLVDALPQDANGQPLPQASALFVARDGRIVASTDPAFVVGQQVPWRHELDTLARGASRHTVLATDGALYAIGLAMSGGYREYDSDGRCHPDDVAGVTLLRLCELADTTDAHPAARFEPASASGRDLCEIATFRCGEEWLGLRTHNVIEATDGAHLSALPGGAPHLAGLVLHGDTAVPVVDLRVLRGGSATPSPLIVFCLLPGGTPIGLCVDELGRVVEVEAQTLQPLSSGLSAHDPLAAALVQGGSAAQPMLTLLDPARLAQQALGRSPADAPATLSEALQPPVFASV